MEGIVLFLAAAAFTMLNGANDGGTLVAVGLTVRGISPIVAVVGLALAVAIVPVLIGTRVATTLTSRLVSLDGDAGRLALLTAVVSAVVVTAGLSWRGLPTSLTLALVGGIAGVGWGYALPVSWPFIGLVLLLAAVAPLAGLAAAFGLSRINTRLSAPGGIDRRIRRMHLAVRRLRCQRRPEDAGGVRRGQRAGDRCGRDTTHPDGRHRPAVSRGRGSGAAALRRFHRWWRGPRAPPEAVATELASAGVVLGTAALGAPVSMTQAISGGLIGSGITRGYRRVRWRAAAQIGLAWALTLPASFVLAAGLGRLGGMLL